MTTLKVLDTTCVTNVHVTSQIDIYIFTVMCVTWKTKWNTCFTFRQKFWSSNFKDKSIAKTIKFGKKRQYQLVLLVP